MELPFYYYIIAIVGGAVAGFINTLAGNGSAITLTILTELLGLPGNIANGTNRIGVLGQSSVGTIVFFRYGKINFQSSKIPLIIICLGAFSGVFIAIQVSNEQFMQVFKYLLCIMFIVVLIKPGRWILESKRGIRSSWWLWPIYFGLGFYGGFIQMGMGVLFLIVLVLLARYPIIQANALKTFVVAVYTVAALAIFHMQGLVHWQMGLILAIGQVFGGWYTARLASRFPRANELAYWVLVLSVLIALISLFT